MEVVTKAVVETVVVVVGVVVKHESYKGLFTPKIFNASKNFVDKNYL